jgi:hypothetical protein
VKLNAAPCCPFDVVHICGFTSRELDHVTSRFIHLQRLHPRRRFLVEVTNSANDIAAWSAPFKGSCVSTCMP